MQALSDELEKRRTAGTLSGGTLSGPHEYFSRAVLDPGHERRQRNASFIRNAVTRGASVPQDTWELIADDLSQGLRGLPIRGHRSQFKRTKH